MSWTISRALAKALKAGYASSRSSRAEAEASSAASCADSAQCARSSSTPIAGLFCAPGKMKEFSNLSRSGMTSKPLTENHGEALLTYYREGFLASTSRLQIQKAADSMARRADYGLKCGELSAKFDQDSCSLKTVQTSATKAESELLRILPKWGMTRNGALFQLKTRVPPTSERGGGASQQRWQTPTLEDAGRAGSAEAWEEYNIEGRTTQCRLRNQVHARWPTPTTQESEHPNAELTANGRRKTRDGKSSHSLNLADSVMRWPTPDSRGFENTGQLQMLTKMTGDKEEYMGMAYRAARKKKESLWPTPDAKGFTSSGSLGMLAQKVDDRGEFLAMGTRAAVSRKEAVWPTLSVNDGHCGTGPSQFQRHTPGLPVAVLKKEPDGENAEARRLNPDWVEWLMSWPVGWTSLSPINMEYYADWLRQAKAGTWWDADPAETQYLGGIIPRVSAGCPNRVSRISLLGNGQVPSVVKLFWNLITNFEGEYRTIA